MLLFAVIALPLQASAASNSFWKTPTIQGYGKIHYLADAAYQPDPKATYKIVFALTKGAKSPDQVNGSLDHVARAVNLYVAAGVPLDHLKFVAVASGAATPLVLDNAHYRAKFGVDNPNLKLIEELRKAGVDVSVCAQAVAEHHFQYGWVSKHVTLALSGLTTTTVLQQQGYALSPL
ncbi:DsrE family protein [Oleiagrimonas citrea]|uniref:DsrE family protein n=2 Tax=Rhodanobacteraceae TaxID=1775411 RepID=A0A846ZNR0_9GAMM|nr:DsrE family protein [Oleiagrimonas citrea]NKZ39081.1 DsrE family protein [Oleiagrimonas citrea]RAP57688.1 sulfur reduction protein DsrE [Oleiagrimonas sp. MCCC 1A03011]